MFIDNYAQLFSQIHTARNSSISIVTTAVKTSITIARDADTFLAAGEFLGLTNTLFPGEKDIVYQGTRGSESILNR